MTYTYSVSFKLAGMLHSYLVEAENEFCAIQKVLEKIPHLSRSVFHDFKIERYKQEWN